MNTIREVLDVAARQTTEIIALRSTCERIEKRLEQSQAEQDAKISELVQDGAGNKRVFGIVKLLFGALGAVVVGGISTWAITTIRLEERQVATDRALEAVQVRGEREAEQTRTTLEGVREALVELRTEQRALRERFDRAERERNEGSRRQR